MIAGMDIRDEGLDAVGDVFDRSSQQDRKADHRHVLVIDVQLHPEGAADVGGDDADAGFRDAIMARIEVLKLVRRLGAVMHREHLAAGIVVGDDGARLERHRGMAAEAELLLHHMSGGGKGIIDAAAIELASETGIAGATRIDQR